MHLPRLAATLALLLSCATPSAAQAPTVADPLRAVRAAQPTRIGSRVGVIQGNALTSINGSLGNGTVRLRDARSGRIVATTKSDKAGLFEFRGVEPGTYVVELIGADQSILAASQILYVNAGDAVSAVVKLPFRVPPFAGVLGHTAASAAVVMATAAAAGVLATQVSGDPISPRR
jgi:hypothetical protein